MRVEYLKHYKKVIVGNY